MHPQGNNCILKISIIGGLSLIILILAIMVGVDSNRRLKAPISGTPGAPEETLAKEQHAPNRRKPSPQTRERSGDLEPGHVNLMDFKPEQFETAWNQALKGSTENDRLTYLSLVVSKMVASGKGNIVIDKILGSFGPGKSRCYLIGAAFMAAEDPSSFAKTYERLEFDDEKAAAREGIASGLGDKLAMSGEGFSFDRSKLRFLGASLDEVMSSCVLRYFAGISRESPEEHRRAFDEVFKLDMSESAEKNLLVRLASTVPFDSWKRIEESGITLSKSECGMVVSKMIQRDPQEAMKAILGGGDPHQILSVAVGMWLARDANRPITWLNENARSLSTEQKAKVVWGIAEYSALQGDFGTGYQWLKQIDNPELRKEAEGKLWTFERETLRKEVNHNPAETLQSIIGGRSKYGDYWLEEAMGAWLAKDFDNAQAWHQKNWNSLPADKAQYVAAALANQAVNQGATATARQWAAFIQDPKTKQRIEAGIAKAEEAKQN